jgi:hypothetical protein
MHSFGPCWHRISPVKQSAGGLFTPIPHCSSQLVMPGPRSYVLLPVTAAK